MDHITEHISLFEYVCWGFEEAMKVQETEWLGCEFEEDSPFQGTRLVFGGTKSLWTGVL